MRRISSAPLRGGNPANSSARRNPARRTGRSEEKDGIVILKGNSLGGQPAAPAPFSAGLAGRFNVMLSFSRRKKRSSGLNVGKFPNNQIGKTTERWEPRRSRDKTVAANAGEKRAREQSCGGEAGVLYFVFSPQSCSVFPVFFGRSVLRSARGLCPASVWDTGPGGARRCLRSANRRGGHYFIA